MTPSRGTNRGHKPPSRIRYEESHPVVSFRAKEEDYQQLVELLAKSGKSMGDFFREALGVQQADTRKVFHRGYEKGFAEAKRLYAFYYPCSVCGGTIEMSSPGEKEAVAKYMGEHGWAHGACHEKRRGGR